MNLSKAKKKSFIFYKSSSLHLVWAVYVGRGKLKILSQSSPNFSCGRQDMKVALIPMPMSPAKDGEVFTKTRHYMQNLLQEGFCNSVWLMTQTHGNGHEGWRMAEGTTQLLRWAPGPPSHTGPVSSTAELRIHGCQTGDTLEAQVIWILCCFFFPPDEQYCLHVQKE